MSSWVGICFLLAGIYLVVVVGRGLLDFIYWMIDR